MPVYVITVFVLSGQNQQPNHPNCPVESFVYYRSKLNPLQSSLWQRPKKIVKETDVIWYDNSPLGKNTLGNMLKSMSTMYNLSTVYTNHCLRATCITTLDLNGFEARQIMNISGHKSETSLKNYSHHVSESVKRKMSHALSNSHTDMSLAVVPAANNENADPDHFPLLSAQKETTNHASSVELVLQDQSNCMNLAQTTGNHTFNFSNCVVNINYVQK